MLTKAAVLFEQPGKWEVVELELEGPRQDELLIKMAAAGLCHSDDHLLTGDLPLPPGALPLAGGHEGAGVVEEVGPNTPGWKVGDRVVLTFLPMCGLCRWCASGMQNLCDNGARVLAGVRADGSRRMKLNGEAIGQAAGVATFSEWSTVSVQSAVKCPDDVPLDVACLTSCGVGTGWGSAVHSAEVRPGRRGDRDGHRRHRDERCPGRRPRRSIGGHRRRSRRNEANGIFGFRRNPRRRNHGGGHGDRRRASPTGRELTPPSSA